MFIWAAISTNLRTATVRLFNHWVPLLTKWIPYSVEITLFTHLISTQIAILQHNIKDSTIYIHKAYRAFYAWEDLRAPRTRAQTIILEYLDALKSKIYLVFDSVLSPALTEKDLIFKKK